ncbi:outer membrane lipoprotein LolB [Amphritea opalescens]|uniref:Outer-membrane lipoprotein LolB n=1 Tax=Amphritea opalescens TaxID=2490544 RepID=A0A430KSY3_9GAMM|nr:lipoprotein insertase outer membrane protein LolB [Amphritea opalescens]RTE66655.1 outer membrane lipoprotein LolB [Amphritea opalescens]
MRLRILVVAALILLSGCSGLTPQPTTTPERPWSEHYQMMQATDSWQLTGKIGIRAPAESHSASLYWEQSPQRYQIDLTGPLGQGGARIEGDELGVSIDIAGEQPLWAPSAEQLMEDTLGWQFPVQDVRYWILGIPAPSNPFELSLTQQLADEIIQNGWKIKYLRYNYQTGHPLPEKLTISRDDLRLTIIAKEWQIPH